jgi:hypothetical protein
VSRGESLANLSAFQHLVGSADDGPAVADES